MDTTATSTSSRRCRGRRPRRRGRRRPIADHGLIRRASQLEDLVLGVEHLIVVGVEQEYAIAIHAQVIDAVAVPVTDYREVPAWPSSIIVSPGTNDRRR